VFHVVIGCIHEIALSKTQALSDGRMKPCNIEGVCEIEYQLVTLPHLTSLLHGSVTLLFMQQHTIMLITRHRNYKEIAVVIIMSYT